MALAAGLAATIAACGNPLSDDDPPSDSTEYNATFSAPPPEVTLLNVDIASVGLIPDAPAS